MAKINLLPWREELRKQKLREFYVMIGGAVFITVGVIVLIHTQLNGVITFQQARNTYIQNEIKQVEGKIKEISDLEKQKELLISRMRIIERLQRNRPEVVHLFDELAKQVPSGLHLKKLTEKDRKLTMQGIAQSNARVSAFMRSLDSSRWFADPSLEVIQATKGNDNRREFTLVVKQESPSDTPEDNK
jgi:type IV pilus assembly protein PilN